MNVVSIRKIFFYFLIYFAENDTICKYQQDLTATNESRNFVNTSANDVDVYVWVVYDVTYAFKIQVLYDGEWLDFSEIKTILVNGPTIENSFYGSSLFLILIVDKFVPLCERCAKNKVKTRFFVFIFFASFSQVSIISFFFLYD